MVLDTVAMILSYPHKPCRQRWRWSPCHIRSGSRQACSDSGRSHTGCHSLRTHHCLQLEVKQNSLRTHNNVLHWFNLRQASGLHVWPEQWKPSPENPSLHAHRYEPMVLRHSALLLHMWVPLEHSSRSLQKKNIQTSHEMWFRFVCRIVNGQKHLNK